MTVLPEPPAAPAAGQATNPLTDAVIQAAIDNLVHEARRESTSPPTPQRETPTMSPRTTEITRAVMYCSLATVPPGLVATAILVASEHADPTVIGMICGAPAAIAVPILAIARLLRRAKDVVPPEIHHHYEGTVYQDQRNVHSHTRGVWAKTTNQQ
ncbi:hypothetical protein ACFY0F_23560 [Streptomyces sp. NPDC001544]|uniref:hypothetical protein n=1 Tax=Streptomyces sp. NPDC001544 TaxID=3364584 RepID=UPI0036994C6F